MPRSFGPAILGKEPNDLLKFDYSELGPDSCDANYLLMLKDDLSDYKFIFIFQGTGGENAAVAIIDWWAACGVPKGLMS